MTTANNSSSVLPPHQHEFDWYVIPEIKGERGKDSFISYDTKSQGWRCQLCQVGDHLSGSVEEHCHTWEHLQNQRKLNQRRDELQALVRQREEEIWEQLRAQQEAERLAAAEAEAKTAQNEHAEVDAAYDAKQRQRQATGTSSEEQETEERPKAPLLQKKPRKWETIDHEVSNYYNSASYRAASIRNQLLSDKVEDEQDFSNSQMIPGESQHERVRRLRAQRLSGKKAPLGDSSNVKPTSVESRREARLREKEAKRRTNAALTQEHLARQQQAEEAYARERAREAARRRFFESFCGTDLPVFPESISKAQTACADFVGETSYFCGLESGLVASDSMED